MREKFQALVIEVFGIIKYTKLLRNSLYFIFSARNLCKTEIIAVQSS